MTLRRVSLSLSAPSIMPRTFISAAFAIAAAIAFIAMTPSASADIIGIQNATACGGGTICNAGSAFSLTAIQNGSQSLRDPGDPTVTVGNSDTAVYRIDNDTASSTFTLNISGTLANNAFINCQENGGFANHDCSISGSLGTVDNPTGGGSAKYGPPAGQMTNWNFSVMVTFTDVPVGTDFDLNFASWAHAGADTATVTPTSPVPEPSSLLLLGSGLLGVGRVVRRSRRVR